MLSRNLRRQMRRLLLRARRAVEDLLGGHYRSVFKGSGIAFEEVREYQPGDDIRAIDWNVTARMGHPFVKRFIEERELTLMLVVDVSGSQRLGTIRHPKREVAAEIAALLAFCAVANHDKVGLVAFSDRLEQFVPPRKGTRHALRLIRDILFQEPTSTGTSLRLGLDYVNRVLRRRAIVFLMSDFLDDGYESALRRTARRHDLVAVHCGDALERRFPDIGLVDLEDAESGEQFVVDTSAPHFGPALESLVQRRHDNLQQLAGKARVDWIDAATDGTHLDSLMRFFRQRERRYGHT